jgi:hypothetical protein
LSAHLNTDMSITVTITPVRSATCCGDWHVCFTWTYCRPRDADKSLARPGRKQATTPEDFDANISYL